LKTLQDEFLQNRITIDSTLKLLNTTAGGLSFVLNNIQVETDINISPKQLDSVLGATMTNPYWKRSEYTLKSIENSGKLSSLSNQNLKTRLYEYSLVIKDITDKDTDAIIGFNYLLNYYKEKGSLRNLDYSSAQITESQTSLS
jgi:hypothetical protein